MPFPSTKNTCQFRREVIKKNQERIDNAQQLMLDGELPLLEYKSIKRRYEEAIKRLQEQISDSEPRIADYKKYLDFGFNLLENVDWFYEEAELALILNGGAGSSGNKKGQNQGSLILSSR